MIEQKELRLGNWVKDKKTNTFVQVEGLQFTGRIVTGDDTYDDGKRGIEPEPIPLSPEILENAGFRKEVYGGFDDRDFCRWHIGYNIYVYNDMHTYLQDGKNIVEHIKYVHQIQNLYFALTGEELPIDSPVEKV